MKCRKYTILLLTFAFSLFLAGCESDFTDSLVSPSIEIKRVPTISESELTVIFTPSKTVARYEYAIGDDADQEAFLNGTYLGIKKVEDGETLEVKFSDLTQSKVYTIFARAYGINGTAGPLASIKEKTRRPSANIDATVQFESENSTAITLVSDVSYYKYDFALGFDSDRANFENGTLEGMKSREEFSKYTANYFNLQPGTDYIFFVRAYDRISNLPTATVEIPIRTADRGSMPAVECKVNHIDQYCGYYHFTPNEHVGRVSVAFTLQGELDDTMDKEIYWKGNLLQMLESWTTSNSGLVSMGYDEPFTAEYTTPKMLLGEYDPYNYPIDLFVIVYNKEMKPFAVQKFTFHTPTYDNNAKKAVVDLKISHITQKGALYEFTPNEHTMGMFFETFDADWVQETMQSDYYYEGYLELYLYYYGYWNYMFNNKTTTFPERTADPGKKYYVYYMPMNANGVDGFGSMNYQIYETLPADE